MHPVSTTKLERDLAKFGTVVGMDEVGRGALAGPVAVGACVSPGTEPSHALADSKYLSAHAREELVSAAAKWAWPCAVGMASAAEVDELGITGALRRAGLRALQMLILEGAAVDVVLLDGTHDWLTPKPDLLSLDNADDDTFVEVGSPRVTTKVKADATCSVVSAASIVAKVTRDHLMASLPDPGYGWASNKGYASAAHRKALAELGISAYHRQTWRLLPQLANDPTKKA
ncbi:MAG: ribonuclease HII [Acidobacteriota bacterium]|nr:ribonuclease HII [Acidobacteriota bacterium]